MLSQEIRDRALRILEIRDHSAKELTDKLVRKGETPEDAEACVAWLCELGFIDDERYAAALARRYTAKGYGAGRIRQELAKRGVDRALWEDALGALPEEKNELDRLVQANLGGLDDRKELKRFTDRLLRRGFTWSEIREALARNRAGEGIWDG